MNVLVFDAGGTHVKALVSGQHECGKCDNCERFIGGFRI